MQKDMKPGWTTILTQGAYVAFIPALLAGFGLFLAAHANKTGFLPKHMSATAQHASQP